MCKRGCISPYLPTIRLLPKLVAKVILEKMHWMHCVAKTSELLENKKKKKKIVEVVGEVHPTI